MVTFGDFVVNLGNFLTWILSLLTMTVNHKDGRVETGVDVRSDPRSPLGPPNSGPTQTSPVADGGSTPIMALCD